MAEPEEAREAAPLGLEGVDGEALEAAAARVSHVVLAAAEAAAHPRVDEVERQRRVHADVRVEAARRLPGPVAHAGHVLADAPGGLER